MSPMAASTISRCRTSVVFFEGCLPGLWGTVAVMPAF